MTTLTVGTDWARARMPLYHFDLRDGKAVKDDEGMELPDVGRAQIEAVQLLADMVKDIPIRAPLPSGYPMGIEVRDAEGFLFSLSFACSWIGGDIEPLHPCDARRSDMTKPNFYPVRKLTSYPLLRSAQSKHHSAISRLLSVMRPRVSAPALLSGGRAPCAADATISTIRFPTIDGSAIISTT